jgi:hypothetical protein
MPNLRERLAKKNQFGLGHIGEEDVCAFTSNRTLRGRSAPDAADSENRKVWRRGSLLAAIALLLSIPACSQEKPDDLANKGIEDLMTMGAKEIWSMGIT